MILPLLLVLLFSSCKSLRIVEVKRRTSTPFSNCTGEIVHVGRYLPGSCSGSSAYAGRYIFNCDSVTEVKLSPYIEGSNCSGPIRESVPIGDCFLNPDPDLYQGKYERAEISCAETDDIVYASRCSTNSETYVGSYSVMQSGDIVKVGSCEPYIYYAPSGITYSYLARIEQESNGMRYVAVSLYTDKSCQNFGRVMYSIDLDVCFFGVVFTYTGGAFTNELSFFVALFVVFSSIYTL